MCHCSTCGVLLTYHMFPGAIAGANCPFCLAQGSVLDDGCDNLHNASVGSGPENHANQNEKLIALLTPNQIHGACASGPTIDWSRLSTEERKLGVHLAIREALGRLADAAGIVGDAKAHFLKHTFSAHPAFSDRVLSGEEGPGGWHTVHGAITKCAQTTIPINSGNQGNILIDFTAFLELASIPPYTLLL
jgi:hypothetical protein